MDFEKYYEQPEVITVGNERIRAREVLFQPARIGLSTCGIQNMLYSSLMKSDHHSRVELYGNIVLAGGSNEFLSVFSVFVILCVRYL